MDGTGSVRHARSAGRVTHRSYSNSTAASMDDSISLSSSRDSGVFKRSSHTLKTSSGDFSTVRAAAGISRMRYGRARLKGPILPSEQNGFADVSPPKGGHTMSSHSLGNLAEVGIKVRRRRRSTIDSWGRNRTPGQTKYFDRVRHDQALNYS